MGGKDRIHHLDAEVAGLAARQHGVVAIRQLLALGISRRAVQRREQAGRLHRVHRGVYAVGHRRLSRDGCWMAAVLSGGAGAVLSHRAAGAACQLRSWSGRSSITVPKWRRSTGRIELHFSSLPFDEITIDDGVPITTVPRTLLDLASVLDAHALARAVNEAEVRRLADPLSLPDLLERHRGERGTAALRGALESAGYGLGITRSELEELFLRFLAESSLPHPELNAAIQVGDRFYEADCLWRRQRLIVELQGATFHGTAQAMTRDAARNRRLVLAGWNVVQVTRAQLKSPVEADALAADLRWIVLGGASRSEG